MVVLAQGPLLELHDLPENIRDPKPEPATIAETDRPPPEKPLKIEENERILIEEALRKCSGNRTAAAKLLGISRRTLHRRLAK